MEPFYIIPKSVRYSATLSRLQNILPIYYLGCRISYQFTYLGYSISYQFSNDVEFNLPNFCN